MYGPVARLAHLSRLIPTVRLHLNLGVRVTSGFCNPGLNNDGGTVRGMHDEIILWN